MKHQLKTVMIVGSLALSSIFAFGSIVQALPVIDNGVDDSNNSDLDLSEEAYIGTQFTCVPDGNGNVATVGQRPGGEPIPVIVWTSNSSKYFGQNITPQSRCRI
ncbi:MAG: COP23 domain-containing protein, partial [Dolichospermum sp.]